MHRVESTLPTVNPALASRLGFGVGRGGAHGARTIMLDELQTLLRHVDQDQAPRERYRSLIVEENCLGKRSARTRHLTYRHLVELYALDPGTLLFRALRYYWRRDASGRALLALLLAYARDPVLRTTAPLITRAPAGMDIAREQVEEYIDSQEPGRFSPATLKSTAQNASASWTKSGHLAGSRRKVRSRANATAGSVAYALFLGYLLGARGQALFETEYAGLLDCSKPQAMDLATEASRRGWLVFKRIGDVVEVLFPNLISASKEEALREQN